MIEVMFIQRRNMKELFKQLYPQKKIRINISITDDLKTYLVGLKTKMDISISELIESLYQTHKESVRKLESIEAFPRRKCQKGEAMFEKQPMKLLPLCLTPAAIRFFDVTAQSKGLDRSKLIRLAIKQIF